MIRACVRCHKDLHDGGRMLNVGSHIYLCQYCRMELKFKYTNTLSEEKIMEMKKLIKKSATKD